MAEKLLARLLPIFLLFTFQAGAQFKFGEHLPERVSLHPYAKIANTGGQNLSVQTVLKNFESLDFKELPGENADLGFTTDFFWVHVTLENTTDRNLEYYLETARPITDYVALYQVSGQSIEKSVTGDRMKCSDRAYCHRKSIFRVLLSPGQKKTLLINMSSDGEVISLPLMLRTSESLMEITSMEQFVFGIFYGILFIAAIIYLFFYFGIRERTFFYYSFYVVFIGLLQFAVDGYFYQYIMPDGGWFSQRAVLIFATIAAFFLGRYSQVFLKIKNFSKFLNRCFDVLYGLLALLLIYIVVASDISLGYPLANILGLFVLLLIISSIVLLYVKKERVDWFFAIGIFFLVAGFVVFILNNFGQIQTSFVSQNASKFGTGVEVIFLSLSMANLIARLKNEREDFNRLALARAEEMNDMKTYFLSNISHELRTPLNAIMTLSAEMAKTADEKIRDSAKVIKYSSHSLLSSVNDILDFSKIEKGELRLENVHFQPARVLEHIKNNAAQRAKDQGILFHFTQGAMPETLSGDVVRLGQIVNNILSNAVKFTSHGSISFKVAGEKVGDKFRLQLVVEDTGVGIPPSKIGHIFGSFTQDNIDNKRKFGGLGLGLFIVKTLVEMQGGKIDVKSSPGTGSVFTVWIDYEIVAQQAVVTDTPHEIDLGGCNILVAEDNAINQMVIKMITKKWKNTSVSYAANGREALDEMAKMQYDLVLMDLQMPVMDGYEATIAIRSGEVGEHHKNIPIIAVTADVMETTKDRVIEIGMNGYLSKPLKSEVLFEAVRRAVCL